MKSTRALLLSGRCKDLERIEMKREREGCAFVDRERDEGTRAKSFFYKAKKVSSKGVMAISPPWGE